MKRAMALTAALLVAVVGYTADPALAAYKAKVDKGTLKLTGNAASEVLVLRLAPGSPNTLQIDVGGDFTADFSFDRTTFTAIDVEGAGGNDEIRVDQINGSFPDELLTMNGGDGADTLLGGSGAETLLGGKGNDFVAGRDGNDHALGGDGDDSFPWNPGDDSDVIDGQGGKDLLDFFGTNIGETIGVSADGSHVRFTRDVATIAMDLDGVERVAFHAFGGSDTITVDDLAGTDTKMVALDLSAAGGGGDAFADTVTVTATNGADRLEIGSAAGELLVSGLAAQVQVAGAEAALDAIVVDGGAGDDAARYNGTADADTIGVAANGTAVSTSMPGTALLNTTAVESLVVLGLGGADTIAAVGNLAPLTALTIDGGEGDDDLRGGNGADVLIGGNGSDAVDGNQGSDSAVLGDGDDSFQWDPGDGSDTVDGQAGTDLLDFFGSSIGETILVTANGGRARLTRDIGGVTMDFDQVEDLAVHALGGTDLVVVDDLSGTDVENAVIDLNLFGGGADGQPDTIVANGTSKNDVVQVGRSGSEVLISGLPAGLRIAGGEGLGDTLLVQTLGGDDDVAVDPTVNELIKPVVNLGAGE